MMSPNASAPGPGNEGGKPVSFNKGDALRIASAVQKVERGDRGLGPSKLPRAFGGGGAAGGLFRMVITQDTLTCGGLVTGVKVFWADGDWHYDDVAFSILDSLYLISSEYHVGDKLWCSYMEDTGYMEVVMPASECSCVGASRTKLAGMIFGDLEEATQTGVQVLVLQDGCIMRMPTERCLTE